MEVAEVLLSQVCLLVKKEPTRTWNPNQKARSRAVWLCQPVLWGFSCSSATCVLSAQSKVTPTPCCTLQWWTIFVLGF